MLSDSSWLVRCPTAVLDHSFVPYWVLVHQAVIHATQCQTRKGHGKVQGPTVQDMQECSIVSRA